MGAVAGGYMSTRFSEIRHYPKTHCMLCGREGAILYESLEDRLYGTSGVWSIRQCLDCRIGWLDPCPAEEDLPKLYASNAYYTHRATSGSKGAMRSSIYSIFRLSPFQELALYSVKGGVIDILSAPSLWSRHWYINSRSPKLLDLGCGNGSFLKVMRNNGWTVQGVEPDPDAAALARNLYNVNVLVGTIDSVDLHDEKYSLVRMNHVIEHLPNPMQTLNDCYSVLEPNGRLVVLTPNLDSFAHHRVYRSNWLHLDPPRHLHLFTSDSLRRVVEQSGFRVESVNSSSRGASDTWKTSWVLSKKGSIPHTWRELVPWWVKAQASLINVWEFALCHWSNVGNDLQLIAVKESAK